MTHTCKYSKDVGHKFNKVEFSGNENGGKVSFLGNISVVGGQG
jgi:hypothetical protein